MLHDEAIYIHGGQQYHVDRLDWDRRKALRPAGDGGPLHRQRSSKVELKTLESEESRPDEHIGDLGLGEIGLVDKVTVYKKIKLGTP